MRLDNATKASVAYDSLQKVNDKLNCIITFVKPDKEGIPIALKDNVSTKSILTTASCKILENYVPVYDAEIVKRLNENGFVTIAKTNMDELAMGGTNITALTGPVRNPYDLSRISGGSSGGSAALVASGVIPCAIGSDTGDSIRKPAAYCGVIGVKPSYGRISRYGIIPYSSSLDHVGYFVTNVKDASKMLEVLASRDDKDMTSSYETVLKYSELLDGEVKGKRILVFKNVIDDVEDKTILDSFNKVITGLKEKGAIVEEVYFDETLMKAILPVYYIIANGEATANHANLDGVNFGKRVDGKTTDEIMFNSRTAGFGPWIKKRFVIGSYALFEENQERIFRKAQKIRRLIVNEILDKLQNADCLIAPTCRNVAPKIVEASCGELLDEQVIADHHMTIANFSGLPSMSMPMGFVDGLPIGVCLTCNLFKEDTMFNIAKAIEDITGLEDLTKEDF